MARAQQLVTIIIDKMSIIMYGWQVSRISASECVDLSVRQDTELPETEERHMRTWPRILVALICSLAVMLTQHIVTAEAQECPGGYSATFQLDGEVNHPKTYALQDLLCNDTSGLESRTSF